MKLLLSCILTVCFFIGEASAHKLYTKPVEFEVAGHKAFVLKAEKPAKGMPWVWYAPTLPRHPDRSHTWYIKQLLEKGVSVAGCDLGEVRGSPRSIAEFTQFYDEMVKRGFSKKPILLGQSRGGLMMLTWAMNNPQKVTAFAGIYPVCNLKSWPIVSNRSATLTDYNMSLEKLTTELKKYNPIDNLEGLAKNLVPMFFVHGDSDRVVPLKDNSAIVEARYRQLGGLVKVKVIPGKGHAVLDEFFKCQEMIDFLLKPKNLK
jgi:dipeptidyl aminopeptidase/acylaminoacyl peptidase